MNHQSSEPSLPILAAFDFDGTLTLRDSLFPFLKSAVGHWRFYLGLVWVSPVLVAYALRLIPNWKAKEVVLTHFLSGISDVRLQALGERFATQSLSKLLRTEAVKRLRWHQEQGHKTVLVSASPEAYLRPWAREMAFDDVIGTRLKVSDGAVTGQILGQNCYGPEKVHRMKACLGELERYYIYAYGDSKGDRELLSVANCPHYRTFLDSNQLSSNEALPPKANRWERGIILSAMAAAGLYLAIFLWTGAEQFLEAIG
ncbi:MAG: HAD-IB family hydrolase, partial [Cyanobacteria bacterium J06633_2]